MGKFLESLKLKKFQKGTSLIELLVYFALLGIVLIIATDIMIRTSEFSLEASTRNDLQEEARFITNRLAYDVHRAEEVRYPTNPGESITYLWLTIGGRPYIYYLSSSRIYLYAGTTSRWGPVTSNSVTVPTPMNFTHIGNNGGKPTIKATFTLQSATVQKGGPKTKTFETVVGLR